MDPRLTDADAATGGRAGDRGAARTAPDEPGRPPSAARAAPSAASRRRRPRPVIASPPRARRRALRQRFVRCDPRSLLLLVLVAAIVAGG